MENAETLARHGVLYPKAGQAEIYGTGHKNIAWQIQKIPQFRKKYGKFDDLMDEIGAFDGATVISTEDFETALYQPGPLTGFLRQLTNLNSTSPWLCISGISYPIANRCSANMHGKCFLQNMKITQTRRSPMA